ncbi:hypothetical protein [Gordonia soli]|uniref:Uncharacterized protein n=1 Tax=Gordonia soli NBRC 108243 TaxID=1223545 RepID=M0QGE5_9ACTN|nr:hypothetical protein [Gordonia soli]GAC66467.1 hypothetical protein GS4_02_01780 [Gordonia soli NBRC 108243]
MSDIWVGGAHLDDDEPDATDAWLVSASRGLAEPDDDVRKLISRISGGLDRARRPARDLDSDIDGITISDRVLKQVLATRIRSDLGRLVVFVAVDGAGTEMTAIRIGLVARYHDDLATMSGRIRDVTDDVLEETLGTHVTAAARRAIHIRWQDVYSREWLN